MGVFGWFGVLSVAGWVIVVGTARLVRGPRFAVFLAVLFGIYSLIATTLAPSFRVVLPAFAALHVAVVVNWIALSRPKMRPLVYRILVSWPAALFTGGTLLAWPWAIAVGLGLRPVGVWIPYALATIGLVQSLSTKRGVVDLVVSGPAGPRAPKLGPHPHGSERVPRSLRIVQISDPHLGPFMSVERLRRIVERAVQAKPDLVVLTGDFLTMESQSRPELLETALEPLRAIPGKAFACFGNHDHEAPGIVVSAMKANGVRLLVDDSAVVETGAGPVQIVGMDFTFRDRRAHLARVCTEHPRVPGALRVVLLHDPGAFRHLPDGEGDLVLSGHTHGGQLGLVSLGLPWTVLRLFGIKIPDHGFWARGTDRLWVHRGTGVYGFPLRLGVPAEESILQIHCPAM
jgi:predicted MPP superfamily phosphohydrolase